jgi:hypothetical protein
MDSTERHSFVIENKSHWVSVLTQAMGYYERRIKGREGIRSASGVADWIRGQVETQKRIISYCQEGGRGLADTKEPIIETTYLSGNLPLPLFAKEG